VAGTSFAIRGKLRNFIVPSSSEITIPLKTIDHKYNISIMILVITEGKRSVACAYKQKCDQDVSKQLFFRVQGHITPAFQLKSKDHSRFTALKNPRTT
jgi:hypothetical protein